MSDDIVKSIQVRQDVGFAAPKYLRVWLDLHEDGTVTWRDMSTDPGF